MGRNIPNKRSTLFHFYDQAYHSPIYTGRYNDRALTVESSIGERSGAVMAGQALQGGGISIDVSGFVSGTLTVEVDYLKTSGTVNANSLTFTDYLDRSLRAIIPASGAIQLTTEVNNSTKIVTFQPNNIYKGIRIKNSGVLMAYYACEEMTGGVLYDSTSNSNNITIIGYTSANRIQDSTAPFSFANFVGYNDLMGSIIPAKFPNLNTDALNTDLINLGMVKQRLFHTNASCYLGDGSTSITMGPNDSLQFDSASGDTLIFTCWATVSHTTSFGALFGTSQSTDFSLRLRRNAWIVGPAGTSATSFATPLNENEAYFFDFRLNATAYEFRVNDVLIATGNITLNNVELRGIGHYGGANRFEGKIFGVQYNLSGNINTIPLSEGSGLTITSLLTTSTGIETTLPGDISNPNAVEVWSTQDQNDYNAFAGASPALSIDFGASVNERYGARDLVNNPVDPVTETLATFTGGRWTWIDNFVTFRFRILFSGDASGGFTPSGSTPTGLYQDEHGVFYRYHQEGNAAVTSFNIESGLFDTGLQNALAKFRIRTSSAITLAANDRRAINGVNTLLNSYRGDATNDPNGVLPLTGSVQTNTVNTWYNDTMVPQSAKDALDDIIQASFGMDFQPFYDALNDTAGESIFRSFAFHTEFLFQGSTDVQTVVTEQFTHSSATQEEFERTSAQDGLPLGLINNILILPSDRTIDTTIDVYVTDSYFQDAEALRPSRTPDFYPITEERGKSRTESTIRFNDSPMIRFLGIDPSENYSRDDLQLLLDGSSLIYADNKQDYLRNLLGYIETNGFENLILAYTKN